MGAAPSAGLVITKIANGDNSVTTASNVFQWAASAVGNNAFVQNYSQNVGGPVTASQYTEQARRYDEVVRGATYSSQNQRIAATPVTLVVSSGNARQGVINTLPPGTAKNVITVGAAESVRPTQTPGDFAELPKSDSYRNIARFTAHGTAVAGTPQPWNRYHKPDLVAPATQVVAAMSPYVLMRAAPRPQIDCVGSQTSDPEATEKCMQWQNQTRIGLEQNGEYSMTYLQASGTSFAAPVGSAAALIASRIYSPTPGSASPALIKAMLTATAKSLRGGLNYAVNGNDGVTPQTIGAAPNDIQGFGRIDVSEITDSSLQKSYVNQSHVFTQPGEIWTRTYAVSNPNRPVKLALAWSDAAIDLPGTSPTTVLQNDLDLEVHVGSGGDCKAYYGNNIDIRPVDRGEESTLTTCNGNVDTKNTVEKVLFNPGVDNVTYFTVKVKARTLTKRAIPCPAGAACPVQNNQDFALYVQNAAELSTVPSPDLLGATGEAATATVSWQGVQPASTYEVWRGTGGGALQHVVTTAALTFTDTPPTSGMYRYAVRAVGTGLTSSYSNVDYAYVGAFAEPIVANETIIKLAHRQELRSLINEARSAASLGTYSFTNNTADIRATDVFEMRTALAEALSALGRPAMSFQHTLVAGLSPVRAIDFVEVRAGLR